MKRSTLWKIVAAVLLLAMALPLFSALTPTQVTAVTTVAPLPYAMEQYGQHQTGIYKTPAAPAIDGARDSSYNLMDQFTDSFGSSYNGIFYSTSEDGSAAGFQNDEWLPDQLDLYGTYDDTYVYFYIETVTRTTTEYSITPYFGFNFSASQKDAQDGKTLPAFRIAEGKSEVTGTDSIIKTERTTPGNDSSTEYQDYDRNQTVYEFRVKWTDIAPAGTTPETDFDRMYFSVKMPFEVSGNTAWWIYGVPNIQTLPNDITIGEAFGDNASTYTPNIVNLLGSPIEKATHPAPEITKVERTDKNSNSKEREFEVTFTVSGVEEKALAGVGVLFLDDAAKQGSNALTLGHPTATVLTPKLSSEADGKLTYTATFSTEDTFYETYFSLRAFATYQDASGITVYGNYYNNTPSYYDMVYADYEQYLNVLMIGSSFSAYYVQPLVDLAKSMGIHMNIGRVYYSGGKPYEHWNWLLTDFRNAELKGGLYSATPENVISYTGGYTIGEILDFCDHWDVISIQSHYGAPYASYSFEEGYKNGLDDSAPYMANLLHYLRADQPDADLYIQQTWAYQVGYGCGSSVKIEPSADGTDMVVAGSENYTDQQKIDRIWSRNQQTRYHQQIHNIVWGFVGEDGTQYKGLSALFGVPLIPSGEAWDLARNGDEPKDALGGKTYKELIGDVLCNGKGGEEAGDFYHDGEGGGGRYLNACVWFEMLTGKDVREATWKPTYTYPLTDERAKAIREVAHEAVQAYKQSASYTQQTINK